MASITSTPSATVAFDHAALWLLSSGIQEPSGGVARYYRIDEQRNAPVSTEITGYAVSTFVYLYKQTLENRYLAAATRAADYLCHTAWNQELDTMPFEAMPSPAYFFDCGIIARGLLGLYRLTRKPEYLRVAEACGRTMARDFAAGPGQYHPILDLPGKQPRPQGSRWSQQTACYQLKSGLAWFELFEETGDDKYIALYRTMLQDALRTQERFLPGAESDTDVMDRLHPYCYFLEAILAMAEQGHLRTELAGGIQRTAHYLRKIAPVFARSDVYAQLLRVRLIADALGAVPLDVDEAAEEARAIRTYQIESEDPRLAGSFYFGHRGGIMTPFANPVSTAFCLQALDGFEQYEAGRFCLTRSVLI